MVDGTEFQGVSRSEAYAGLAQGGVLLGQHVRRTGRTSSAATRVDARRPGRASGARRSIGVIDAIGPMNGMEMRLSLDTMREVYGDYQPAELAVEARSAGQRPALEAKIGALLDRSYPNLEMQSAADAKKEVSDEINRTFNMFNAIVIIAIIVSLLGVINTLAMSVIERTREIGVLRALGASRWQIRATMLDESLMITMAGAVVGVLAGTLIGCDLAARRRRGACPA